MLHFGQSLGSFQLFFPLSRLVLVAPAYFTISVVTSCCVVATCCVCIVAPFAKSALFTDMNGCLYRFIFHLYSVPMQTVTLRQFHLVCS